MEKTVAREGTASRRITAPSPLVHTQCSAARKMDIFSIIYFCCCFSLLCGHPPWQQLFAFVALRHADVTLCSRPLCGRGVSSFCPWRAAISPPIQPRIPLLPAHTHTHTHPLQAQNLPLKAFQRADLHLRVVFSTGGEGVGGPGNPDAPGPVCIRHWSPAIPAHIPSYQPRPC